MTAEASASWAVRLEMTKLEHGTTRMREELHFKREMERDVLLAKRARLSDTLKARREQLQMTLGSMDAFAANVVNVYASAVATDVGGGENVE